jgi:catechol-2,3-dioxygenase
MSQKAAATGRAPLSTLFKNAKAFSSVSVNDLQKAKQFYGQTLGLNVSETPEGLELKVSGSTVFLYPKPNHTPASFTVLNFLVKSPSPFRRSVAKVRSHSVNYCALSKTIAATRA